VGSENKASEPPPPSEPHPKVKRRNTLPAGVTLDDVVNATAGSEGAAGEEAEEVNGDTNFVNELLA